MQAMIFAAGLGTRLRPLTDDRPKAMVEVAGRPLLEHVILKLRRHGFDRIVVNVHHFGEQIIDFLRTNNNFGMDIRISDERELLLNTGGGIKHALPLFRPDEPILIHNVDIASDMDLAAFYTQASQQQDSFSCTASVAPAVRPITALLATNRRQTSRFLLFNKEGDLRGWLNVREGGNVGKAMGTESVEELQRLPFTGIHVLAPLAFEPLRQYPGEVFSIIDFYLSLCATHRLASYPLPDDCRWVDCGKPEALPRAAEILG